MSRQEDFIDAGIAYRMEHGKPMCIAGSNLADVERDLNRAFPFEAGAEHGYQYAVEKACEWLLKHAKEYVCMICDGNTTSVTYEDENLINDFRKEMKG